MREMTKRHANLRRKAKAAAPASATPWMRSVALRVLALADSNFAAAVEYVRWKGRCTTSQEVQAWDAALSVDARQQLLDPPADQPREARQLAEARKFIAERLVVAWVRKQNVQRGIAPTPGAILNEFAGSAGPAGRRSSRHKWLRRLTGRWGGRKCVFGIGDQLTKESFEQKVRLGVATRFAFMLCFGVRFLGRNAAPKLIPRSKVLVTWPENGAALWALFSGRCSSQKPNLVVARKKARACWKWATFVRACNAQGKPVLHVNLDETSLKLHVPSLPGLVFEPCRKRRRRLLRQGHGPDLGTRRAAVTLVAFACNDQRVQAILPQIFVVNKRVVSAADVVDFDERCSGNIIIARRDSSWVTANFMVEVVRALATCLEAELKSHHVVLHSDACRAHSHANVLKECAIAGIYVHFIPACTTAWLQPLDVAVFSKFKGRVVRDVERKRLAASPGALSRPEILEIYREAVVDVIQSKSWASAFQLTGLLGQDQLSQRLLDRIGLAEAPVIGHGLPSYADLEVTFPAGMDIPIEELFETAVVQEKSRRAVRIPLSARLPSGAGLL